MPFKDRTNIKYGKLTAIEYLGKSMWKCKCDCGNEKIVYGGHLENGHTKSCGCFRSPRKNLLNQKFGKLTPIEWEGNGKWKCKCECGNTVSVITYNLLDGNTQSCGCLQKQRTSEVSFKSLVGEKFGLLTVIAQADSYRGHSAWECECECGNKVIVNSIELKNGDTLSCGCLRSSFGEKIIENLLKENNIVYQKEYSFSNLVSENNIPLRFDFAIFNNNKIQMLIEYDGEQHYLDKANNFWKNDNLSQRKNRDELKNIYCKTHNIKLVRIPYWEKNNITINMLLGDQYAI
jgi:hypothetical protein